MHYVAENIDLQMHTKAAIYYTSNVLQKAVCLLILQRCSLERDFDHQLLWCLTVRVCPAGQFHALHGYMKVWSSFHLPDKMMNDDTVGNMMVDVSV